MPAPYWCPDCGELASPRRFGLCDRCVAERKAESDRHYGDLNARPVVRPQRTKTRIIKRRWNPFEDDTYSIDEHGDEVVYEELED